MVPIIVLFAAVDGFALGRFPWLPLAIRVTWGGLTWLAAGRLPVSSPGEFNAIIRSIVLLATGSIALICAVTGGVSAPLFASLSVLPIAALVFTQDDIRAVVQALAASIVSVVVLLLMERAPLVLHLRWLSFTFGLGAIAVYGALMYRRRRESELRGDRARLDALEQLAKSQRQHAESERLVIIGKLAAGVAHEVNNPLAFVKSNLNFLREELKTDDPDIKGALDDVKTGVDRIERIVHDLRSFARADADLCELVFMDEVINEALRISSLRWKNLARAEASVEEALQASVPRGRLVQVLVNLVVNAADALDTATPKPAEPRILVRAQKVGDVVQIDVEDNGPGLSPQVLSRMFEPFFTTKGAGKGTGLGLPLSRDYVERWGGTMSAGNCESGGARLTLTVPLEAPVAAQVAELPPTATDVRGVSDAQPPATTPVIPRG